MLDTLLYAFADALVYFGLVLSLWISFRILGYPDLALEQTFVLGAALFASLVVKGQLFYLTPVVLVAVSLAMGFTCSALRNKAGISGILVSLLAAYIYYSIALTVLQGPNVYFAEVLPRLSLPAAIIVLFGLYSIATGLLAAITRTRAGLTVLASGCNWELANRHKLRPNLSYSLGLACAFLCAMTAGAFHAWRSGYSDVGSGGGLLLTSIFVVLVTRGIQRRIRPGMNALTLFLILLGYLVILQIALRIGLPPQWIRGATAFCLLIALLLLPRRVLGTLALRA